MKRLLARAALVGVVSLFTLSGTALGMSRGGLRTRPVREGHPQGGVPSLASVRIGSRTIVPIRLPIMGFSLLILSGETAGKVPPITSSKTGVIHVNQR